MQHTEDQKAEIKLLYAKRRRNQLTMTVPLVAIIFAFVISEDRQAGTILGLPAQMVGPTFLAIVVAALLFSLRNWRCPACNKYLGRTFNPKHCQSCGVELHG